MDIETFAEWLRRQGHHVVKTESSYWYDAVPHVLQAFPYDWLIQPSKQELRALMKQEKVIAMRYSAPVDASDGMISYHVVLKSPYSLEMLKSQARNGVKRGLNNVKVEEIPFKRLAVDGWVLQQDVLERQKRTKSMTQADWERICLSADGLPGFKAWGAIINDELTAALITCQIGDTFYVPYATSHRKFLNLHVNNALFFKTSCDMLETDGVKGIFFSLHSLDAPDSVNEFKIRMGLQIKPVRQCVEFHPHAKPWVNQLTFGALSQLHKKFPDNSTFSKAFGMVYFCLNGKQPLDKQEWPECLSDIKEQLLGTGVSPHV
jgi:hypothetical protein